MALGQNLRRSWQNSAPSTCSCLQINFGHNDPNKPPEPIEDSNYNFVVVDFCPVVSLGFHCRALGQVFGKLKRQVKSHDGEQPASEQKRDHVPIDP